MTNKEIQKALLRYSELNHSLLDFTNQFYDSALEDINGYYRQLSHIKGDERYPWADLIDTEALQNQIKAMEYLLNGYQLFKTTFSYPY